jgi:CubicO group peptidase (beta-lactamase class C family)
MRLSTLHSGAALHTHDNPPWWPAVHYTLPEFLRHLKEWRIDEKHRRGKDYIYSHSGFMLLHVALERRFGIPYAKLLEDRLLGPLDLPSTILPLIGEDATGNIPPSKRACGPGLFRRGQTDRQAGGHARLLSLAGNGTDVFLLAGYVKVPCCASPGTADRSRAGARYQAHASGGRTN